ncbi:hypothetical protein NC652_033943 [Populus alba x Populus x berolinensis]|nr:hypothetical protein NC652_033943 [Populus alba x Populus x berolinensis]
MAQETLHSKHCNSLEEIQDGTISITLAPGAYFSGEFICFEADDSMHSWWESVAVAKKSQDPCLDFKRSMLEMILETQIFEAEDLEELLQCFLSLNSRQYHGVIVQAFSEIWEVVSRDSHVKKKTTRH